MGPKLTRTVDDLLAAYEAVETHNVLFYSKDRPRDFEVLRRKLAEWRGRVADAAFLDGVGARLDKPDDETTTDADERPPQP